MHNVEIEKQKNRLKQKLGRGEEISFEEIKAVHDYSVKKLHAHNHPHCKGGKDCDHGEIGACNDC